jgi:hypothetical protein
LHTYLLSRIEQNPITPMLDVMGSAVMQLP